MLRLRQPGGRTTELLSSSTGLLGFTAATLVAIGAPIDFSRRTAATNQHWWFWYSVSASTGASRWHVQSLFTGFSRFMAIKNMDSRNGSGFGATEAHSIRLSRGWDGFFPKREVHRNLGPASIFRPGKLQQPMLGSTVRMICPGRSLVSLEQSDLYF